MEQQQKDQHSRGYEIEQTYSPCAILEKQAVCFYVDIEIRYDNQSDDEQRGYQHSCNDRREVVQQLLQAEKIPRRLGGVRGVRWIGYTLQRRVEEQGEDDQCDRKQLDGKRCPEEHLREGLHLIFLGDLYLRRGAASDKDNSRWRA